METIDPVHLEDITGGGFWSTVAKVAKFGGKAIPVVNAAATAYSAYEGYNAYEAARARGESVGSSLWEGVKAFVW